MRAIQSAQIENDVPADEQQTAQNRVAELNARREKIDRITDRIQLRMRRVTNLPFPNRLAAPRPAIRASIIKTFARLLLIRRENSADGASDTIRAD